MMPTRPKIALIDYGSGNLRSVEKALLHAGAEVVRCESPSPIEACRAVVLPGVGSFGDCARSLEKTGMTDFLREWLSAGRPYLGICLGYQILFDESEESPGVRGLGHWRGRVVRFPVRHGLKVPHMGWNTLRWAAPDPVFAGLGESPSVYFVHSFFPAPDDQSLETAGTFHGVEFAAAAGRGKVRGMQFHPEKSQATGLRILENFVRENSSENV